MIDAIALPLQPCMAVSNRTGIMPSKAASTRHGAVPISRKHHTHWLTPISGYIAACHSEGPQSPWPSQMFSLGSSGLQHGGAPVGYHIFVGT